MMQLLENIVTLHDVITILISIIAGGLSGFLALKKSIVTMKRFGYGMQNRKIGIFADSEFNGLRSTITRTGLFDPINVEQLDNTQIGRIHEYDIIVVCWDEAKSYIDDIINRINSNIAMIVYAAPGAIPFKDDVENNIKSAMTKISEVEHSYVTNFRGRLLNDIFTSLATTKFTK